MTILNVSFDFSLNDGEAEKFTGSTEFWIIDGAHDAIEGNPAGSVKFHAVGATATPQSKFYDRTPNTTYEDWGVPPGSTVIGLSNFTADNAHIQTAAIAPNVYTAAVVISGGTIVRHSNEPPIIGDRVWHTLPIVEVDDQSSFPVPSTDVCRLVLTILSGFTPGTTADAYFDNISFDIEYVSAGVDGSGELQSQSASLSGVGLVTAGPDVPVREPTEDIYTVSVDGFVIPLIRVVVVRENSRETARINVPLLFEGLISAASIITVNLEAFDVYGVSTTIELFSGVLDTHSTTRLMVVANCVGSALWPVNKVREFENVSYIADDSNYYAYRTRVDPLFSPGDVGMFGLRQIDVNRVTFSINEYSATMELADIGQM